MAYADGRSRPTMNIYLLSYLRAQGVDINDDKDPTPEIHGGGKVPYVINP